VIALVALLLATTPLPPSVQPWPIGVGPGFRLAAAPAAVRGGRPVGGFRCGVGGPRFGAHIELFVERRVLIVPAGVGVSRPSRVSFGLIRAHRCSYPVRTLDPTGVIEVGARATLGDFFAVWGQRLGPHRIASFTGRVLAFVGGRRWWGDPRRIPLARHAQIVLEVGGYVPPHPRYLFPPGL
jgi:hypothetical protein